MKQSKNRSLLRFVGHEKARHLNRRSVNLLLVNSMETLHILRSGNYVIIISNSGIEWV